MRSAFELLAEGNARIYVRTQMYTLTIIYDDDVDDDGQK